MDDVAKFFSEYFIWIGLGILFFVSIILKYYDSKPYEKLYFGGKKNKK
jgi:hypothetical protein